MTVEELALLGRSVVHLRPAQAMHRARLRSQRAVLRHWPDGGRQVLRRPVPRQAACWPSGFVPADATAEHWPRLAELRAGRMVLLGQARALGDPANWTQPDAPQLWRFHLHYWDWAWGLARADPAAAREVFARLWRSWRDSCPPGQGDAWLPYPAALRAWSWCGLYRPLVAGTSLEQAFTRELAVHAGFLRRHLERDVGGNHLIKNLKALAGLAIFLADERLLDRSLRWLTQQVQVQVLADGGHYERAPAYHCQVLADLVDVVGLVSATGRALGNELTDAISRMRGWLAAMLLPDGLLPLLNDGFPVPVDLLAALAPGPRPGAAMVALRDSGLVRAVAGDWHLLADVGAPCPEELPAHAHAGSLGCVLHARGAPLLVDAGTSTYAAGPVRSYERSTAAHNTVELDGTNSTEVWGAFRAGRRARVGLLAAAEAAGEITIAAAHDGYRWLPGAPRHRRSWLLSRRTLQVDDIVTGRGRHAVVIRWHLAPGTTVTLGAAGAQVQTAAGQFAVSVTATVPLRLALEPGTVAAGFGRARMAPVLSCRADAWLPLHVTTRWRELATTACGGMP